MWSLLKEDMFMIMSEWNELDHIHCKQHLFDNF